MQTLVLSGGGLKSAFLLAIARREDACNPMILHFTEDTPIGHMRLRAVKRLATFYDSNLIVMTVPDVLKTPMLYLEILHSFIHALPVARQFNCYRMYFGWSRDNWNACLNLYHTDTISSFLHTTQKLFAAIQTVHPTAESCKFIAPSELEMPFYLLRDEQILQLGTAYASPWELTYDCLSGTLIHCGACKGCRQRQLLFAKAVIPDLTTYQLPKYQLTKGEGDANGPGYEYEYDCTIQGTSIVAVETLPDDSAQPGDL